jgi:hypothetical protein
MPDFPNFERAAFERRFREGLRQGLQKSISVLLDMKFGKANKRLMAKVRAITDVDKFQALLDAIVRAEKLQEIRDRLCAL